MNLLLDTNILLNIVRTADFKGIMQFLNPDNAVIYVSVVSEAEIQALSLRNNWGTKRQDILDELLDQLNIVEINQLYVNVYAQIDAYSQRANPDFAYYPFNTPRNMGKNDIWIASLAALLGLQLVTTDSDFDHLNDIFFRVRKIDPNYLNKFF